MMDIPRLDTGNKITFNMYGTEDVYFYPHDECNGSYDPSCEHRKNVGMKPIVVAGGKMNIEAVDSSCPSWTKLKYKAGDDELMLDTEFASCLKVGDDLLVTSSTTKWYDDKQAKITAIEHFSHGSVVTIDTQITEPLPGTDGTIIPHVKKEYLMQLPRHVVLHLAVHVVVAAAGVVQEEHRTVAPVVLADRERYVLILFNLRVELMKVVKCCLMMKDMLSR